MPPKHSTESEKALVLDFIIRTALSHSRDGSLHIGWFQSIVDKLVISTWSLINFSVVRNNLGFVNNLAQDELQHEVWQTWIYFIWLCSHRHPSSHPSASDHESFLWSRRLSPCDRHSLVIHGNDVAKFDFRVLNLLNLVEFPDFLDILAIQLLQVLPCLWTVEHPFEILKNSTLRRDWNFDLRLHQVSLIIQPVDLKLWVSPGFSTQSDCSQMKNL